MFFKSSLIACLLTASTLYPTIGSLFPIQSPCNRPWHNVSPKSRHRIDEVDALEYYQGTFVLKQYMSSQKFASDDVIYLNRIRACKKGLYFLESDIAWVGKINVAPYNFLKSEGKQGEICHSIVRNIKFFYPEQLQ